MTMRMITWRMEQLRGKMDENFYAIFGSFPAHLENIQNIKLICCELCLPKIIDVIYLAVVPNL